MERNGQLDRVARKMVPFCAGQRCAPQAMPASPAVIPSCWATPLRICSRPEQAARDVSPYVLNDFRRAVPAMRRGGFGNSCRNCAALVPAYLFSRMKILNRVAQQRGIPTLLMAVFLGLVLSIDSSAIVQTVGDNCFVTPARLYWDNV